MPVEGRRNEGRGKVRVSSFLVSSFWFGLVVGFGASLFDPETRNSELAPADNQKPLVTNQKPQTTTTNPNPTPWNFIPFYVINEP